MKKRVVARVGHGGSDSHNVGPNGYVEADGNMKYAFFLKGFFEGYIF